MGLRAPWPRTILCTLTGPCWYRRWRPRGGSIRTWRSGRPCGSLWRISLLAGLSWAARTSFSERARRTSSRSTWNSADPERGWETSTPRGRQDETKKVGDRNRQGRVARFLTPSCRTHWWETTPKRGRRQQSIGGLSTLTQTQHQKPASPKSLVSNFHSPGLSKRTVPGRNKTSSNSKSLTTS